jgi:hypothetical protein
VVSNVTVLRSDGLFNRCLNQNYSTLINPYKAINAFITGLDELPPEQVITKKVHSRFVSFACTHLTFWHFFYVLMYYKSLTRCSFLLIMVFQPLEP